MFEFVIFISIELTIILHLLLKSIRNWLRMRNILLLFIWVANIKLYKSIKYR